VDEMKMRRTRGQGRKCTGALSDQLQLSQARLALRDSSHSFLGRSRSGFSQPTSKGRPFTMREMPLRTLTFVNIA
jgi:hypothetical protein